MTLFQLIAVPLCVALFVASIARRVLRRTERRENLKWSLLWAIAAIAIARPDLTSAAAHTLGIGRGADCVLYVAVVTGMYVTFRIHRRFQLLEQQITRLVRQQAQAHPIQGSAESIVNRRGEPARRAA